MENGEHAEAIFVSNILSKDKQEFRRLYNAYAPSLYHAIQKIIKCEITTQDILQNVFIKIWANRNKYQSSKVRLFTWMVTIARNETFEYLRSSRHLKYEVSGSDCDTSKPHTFTNSMIWLDLRRLIDLLPFKERAILNLVLSGFTCKDIGGLLKLPEETVKTKMRTSYRKLRVGLQ